MVVMLRQCCCGCSLKTGTIIIGVLNLIAACLGFGSGGVLLSQKETEFKTMGIVELILAAVLIIISILLIVGAMKDRPALLAPWMICAIIIMIVTIIIYIVGAAKAFQHSDSSTGVSYLISALIYSILETYFILVVYSLYRELRGNA
ncbi:hypothetical protein L9F63_012335 [Diploptera punctata]|uniref:Uncharacterized protein n=1 Tax=Diploptera punctata TaxID=6984 RepID=A0AAD8ENG0_DIPPU|nr:hypothetical protein L9F63_012335 [Diploptera punctata]